MERYSIINEKNSREIVLLRGSGCVYKKCIFCDYYADRCSDEDENFRLNKAVLEKVTGIFGDLEVINSGSVFELDKKTLDFIKQVCKEKKISTIHFEAHYLYRNKISQLRKDFADFDLKMKLGLETFDCDFRENVLKKGIKESSPAVIAENFDEANFLFGIKGQTAETMQNDIELGLKYFERICVNIMCDNTTGVKPDKAVIKEFMQKVYPIYKDNKRTDILIKTRILGLVTDMINELLLIFSVVFIYGMAVLGYALFGKAGLYCISAVATILANIEALILVNAFSMEQTLGNVLFAVTFLITDILSECEGKKAANKAVLTGILSSVFFLVLSQSWMLYNPSPNDTIMPSIKAVFSNTPRMIFASLIVYAISQLFDVWLYHKWWKFTEKKFGDRRRFLWLRNNGSTLISQILNTALFTAFAFWGTYDFGTLVSIFLSSYVIYIFTSLLDTPAVYLARLIHDKKEQKNLSVQNGK